MNVFGHVTITSYEALIKAELFDAIDCGAPLRGGHDHVQIHFFDLVIIMYCSSRTFVRFSPYILFWVTYHVIPDNEVANKAAVHDGLFFAPQNEACQK